jgi:hypothetical protein
MLFHLALEITGPTFEEFTLVFPRTLLIRLLDSALRVSAGFI